MTTAAERTHPAPAPSPRHDPAGEGLAGRVRQFEGRLFRSALIARAVFPVLALATLAGDVVTGDVSVLSPLVWAGLVLWTCGTLPVLWNRLGLLTRHRALPLVEMAFFVLFVFLGLGSRSWHILHAYVPIAFCTYFLGVRYGAVATAGMVIAVVVGYVHPNAFMHDGANRVIFPLMPSALAITGFALVSFVRRQVDGINDVIARERASGDAIALSRRRIAAHAEGDATKAMVRRRLEALEATLHTAWARWVAHRGGEASARRGDLDQGVMRIARGVATLGDGGRVEPTPLRQLIPRVVAATDFLGGRVTVHVDPEAGAHTERAHAAQVERIVLEAVTNGRKHSTGDVEVEVEVAPAPEGVEVRVRNPAPAPSQHRLGHLGLGSMEDDARAMGARLARTWDDGVHTLALVIPAHAAAPDDPGAVLPDLRRSRLGLRVGYERALFVVRSAFAVLIFVMIFVKADYHRTLLPLIVALGAALLVWNVAAAVFWRRLRPRFVAGPGPAWADAASMVTVVSVTGGMSTPFIPLAMGTILTLTQFAGWRAGLAQTVALGAGLLAGWVAMVTLPVDDRGTLDQQMPFDWVFNVSTFAIVLVIASGMRWVFGRSDEALDAYEATVADEIAALRQAQAGRARTETQHQLHHSLRQYVAATRMELGFVREDEPPDPDLERMDATLGELHAELRAVIHELGAERDAARRDEG